VVDGDRLAAGVGQADGEVIAGGAVVALVVADIVDGDGRLRVVVDDGAHPLAVGDGGVDRRVEVDEEGLGGLELGVAHDLHGHRVAGLTRGYFVGAAGGDVVGVSFPARRSSDLVVDGDRLAAGVGQADGE